MAMKLSLIDAFTDAPFAGNPAAVCLVEGEASDGWRQSVARELGFSATAYLLPLAEGVFGLRWFTPTVEVDLCGHATLASAHFLWGEGLADGAAPIRFETKSGPLMARRSGTGIELDFPSEPARECPAPADLLGALGARAAWVGRNRFDYLVLVAGEKDVRGLAPDFPALALARGENRGVMVTAVSDDPGFDFVSRYFAPAAGIDEDPVTGSAHCCLGPFWSERLGKPELRAYQASARGGRLSVRVGEQRVYLGGNAVTVFRGALAVPE
jgi:predicted PhzF superfamily epimerase YddE/YHI9